MLYNAAYDDNISERNVTYPQLSTACSHSLWWAAPRERALGEKGFKVALLTYSGPITDQGWNGGGYQGLLRIRDSLGAQISNIETKTPGDIEENLLVKVRLHRTMILVLAMASSSRIPQSVSRQHFPKLGVHESLRE